MRDYLTYHRDNVLAETSLNYNQKNKEKGSKNVEISHRDAKTTYMNHPTTLNDNIKGYRQNLHQLTMKCVREIR
ncbi:hypothetical protein THOM_3035 [Trachipleistophora hominis]|uniref:Uncharacterized protein n=1 Tax=Trachipleistophora hominis TaxID=72359 RepID=L7JRX0_TRAHO|nr:hypothetical protein THOM_3035 [Trachipleistophora hominis]